MTDLNNTTFAQKVATACGLVVFTFLLLVLLYYTFDVVMLVFAAALLAIFLAGLAEPSITKNARPEKSRSWSCVTTCQAV